MIETKSGSGVRPIRAARSECTRPGQVANIAATAGSGTQSISALTSGPGDLLQRGGHVADGDRQRGQVDRDADRRAIGPGRA